MTSRIFKSIVTVAAVILCCSLLFVMGVLYGYACDIQTQQLRDELSIAAAGTEQAGLAFLEALEGNHYRLTWIQSDGTVNFDTHAQSGQMENHLQREEIQQALETGHGSALDIAELGVANPTNISYVLTTLSEIIQTKRQMDGLLRQA